MMRVIKVELRPKNSHNSLPQTQTKTQAKTTAKNFIEGQWVDMKGF